MSVLHVKEVSAKVADSKSFRSIPDTLVANRSNKKVWFAFDTKGYFAFGLFNDEGKMVVKPEVQLHMKLSMGDNDIFVSNPANQHKGVYWFQSIKPSEPGTLSLEFASANQQLIDIVPHVCQISVISDLGDDSEEIVEQSSEALECKTPLSHRKRKLAQDIDSPSSSSTVIPADITSNIDIVPIEHLFVSPEPFPSNSLLEPIRRLERFVGGTSVSLTHSLHLSIPCSLATALLDDRAQIQSISRFSSSAGKRKFGGSSYYFNTPTVFDLTSYFRSKCKISESADIISYLEATFEYFVESSLIYAEEREWLYPNLKLSGQNKYLGNVLGPIMLLRHIVFLCSALDKDFVLSNTDISSSTMEDDKTAVGDRRSASLQKLFKAGAYKIHDVLQFVVKELDEMAHCIF